MRHLGTQQLETERLLLRRFVWEDREAMYRNWESDPEVTKYLTWQHCTAPEEVDPTLQNWLDNYEKPEFYQWAIVPKVIGEPIGAISVVSCDERTGRPEIGYCIGKAWWRQGYTSEALGAVIDFLIGKVGANRVEARHDPRNPNSGAVMRRCGMTYEGTLRQADWNNRGVCDACVYAILAEDWNKSEGRDCRRDRHD